MRSAALLLALLLPAQDPPPAEPPKPPEIDSNRVDRAVDRACEWLLQQAADERLNTMPGLPSGMDHAELVLYALIHGGGDPGSPAYQKLLQTTESAPLARTYRVALTAMCLEAFDRAKYRDRILECAQWLADHQAKNGQWAYGDEADSTEPKSTPSGGGKTARPNPKAAAGSTRTIAKKEPGPETGDNSNSQYALLGLRACAKAGIEVERAVLERARDWWIRCRQADGGWGYGAGGRAEGDPSYGSMTAGATGSLLILGELLGKAAPKGGILKGGKAADPSAAAIQGGFDWLAQNLQVIENPKLEHSYRWVYYWLYAVERAGDLAGLEQFGDRWWYVEGATHLLNTQNPNGSWSGREKLAVSDTCFAILFLRRATKMPPKVASGVRK